MAKSFYFSHHICCASIHPPNVHILMLSLTLSLSLSLLISVFFRPPTSDAAVEKNAISPLGEQWYHYPVTVTIVELFQTG